MYRKILLLTAIFAVLFLFTLQAFAAQTSLKRVEPPFWWAGMKSEKLQLLVYGDNIADTYISFDYKGVRLSFVTKTENPNYLFLDFKLAKDVVPGAFDIHFKNKEGRTLHKYSYELKQRNSIGENLEGFNSSDVIYLITPDRFANGDTGNDKIEGYGDILDRQEPFGRHGGDIRGIIDNLGYIKDMGFTAIWLNPILENKQPEQSYHGYATTDFYKVDPRFGTNEEYLELASKAREKGLKLIMDMILNHCGSEHWWMKDMPTSDWINDFPDYKVTNHRHTVNVDPYVSEGDYNHMVNGWFVPTMPDMNQNNALMANYLIQNSIWWIEYLELGGVRQDTYAYPDKYISAEWSRRIMEEYPRFNIVGEEWNLNPALVSYWQRGKNNADGYNSRLPGLMDFPLQNALTTALNEEESWPGGLIKLYEAISNDFLYPEPENLVIFPDNHDMSRVFTLLNEDYDLFKMSIAYILTMRGIPQIYYGTEILMSNRGTDSHGIIRSDFPGGWKGDDVNAFKQVGLTQQQKEAQAFVRKLLNWRKNADVIHNGRLTHFIPQDGIYAYFRYDDSNCVMVIINKNREEKLLNTDRFKEVTRGYKSGKDIISGDNISNIENIAVPPKSAMIIELN